MNLTITSGKGSTNKTSRLSPDITLSVSRSNQVFLVIYGTKNIVSKQSKTCYQCKVERGQVDGMTEEKVGLERVHVGKPDRVAPGQVESKVIVRNIDRSQVPILQMLRYD